MTLESPQHRLRAWAGAWNVTIERTLETESSVIGVGRRGARGVVLKVVKTPGDEWHSGAVVRAFDGRGVVQVDEFEDGALLLERLSPGDSLADLASAGDDEAATAIVADVIQRMHAPSTPRGCPRVMDWCAGFDRYLCSGDQRIPTSLVDDARARFASLASSQRLPRLLHGDLQHYNILFDTNRGWLAIDPKGIVGEVEYRGRGSAAESGRESRPLRISGNRRATRQSTVRTAGYRSRTYARVGIRSSRAVSDLVPRRWARGHCGQRCAQVGERHPLDDFRCRPTRVSDRRSDSCVGH